MENLEIASEEGVLTKEIRLEGRLTSLYQTKGILSETSDKNIMKDYGISKRNKPFAVNYFKTPRELPLDWMTSMETGTQGSVYQKDD